MNRLIYLTLSLFCLVVAALAVTETEPNDDPGAFDYAGDLGPLGDVPLTVDGTVSTYLTDEGGNLVGDHDFLRFTLDVTTHVSATLTGFSGDPLFLLLNSDLAVVANGSAGEDGIDIPQRKLSPGAYFGIVAGASGPDDDPYSMEISGIPDGALAIQNTAVKFNAKKPERDSAKIVAAFDAPAIDPVSGGLQMSFRGQTWSIEPGRFVAKGGKFLYKGAKGEVLNKVLLDPARSKLKVVLKKGDLGEPLSPEAPDTTIHLRVETTTHILDQIVQGQAKKNGRLLKYRD